VARLHPRSTGLTAIATEQRCETRFGFIRIFLMRIPFLTLGLLALLIGLLWIGQGTGFVAWPRSSFMIRQVQWAYYGAALAVVGLVLMWLARRPQA